MNTSTVENRRPKALSVVAENIPEELKELRQWVTWKYEFRESKWTKPPYQVNGHHHHASSTNPETWGAFNDALKTYQSKRVNGIGFVLSANEELIGIDLDHCFDLNARKGEPWAIDIIQKMKSYSEFSPSGEGIRIFAKGTLPFGEKGKKRGNIEIYSADRYLTVTGHRLKNAPLTIEPRQESITWLWETYIKEKPKAAKPKPNGHWDPSDQELLDRAFAAKNGDKLKQLFDGDISDYPSQSEADLALCSLLSFWATDEAQLDRLFRRSALMRDKWDQKHGVMSYGERTTGKAWADRTEHYQGDGSSNEPLRFKDSPVSSAGACPRPALDPQALFYGLAGRIVRLIRPYSEADDVALLLNILAAFGSVAGCSAYATASHDEHPARLFIVEVGATSKGRKGSGWSPIKRIFSMIDREWSKDRVKTGLSSGEGLIWNVRDPIYKQEAIKEKGRVTGEYQEVMVDAGVADKRLMIIEPEFASTLTVMGREGNILSAIMRQAWDDGNLSPLTKNNPITATGAHISVVAHITQHELLARMDDTSKANGFANRFLFALVRRSKELPEGAEVPGILLEEFAEDIGKAIDFAHKGGIVKRDDPAREEWARVYGPLSAGKPGLTGAILSRAEAQVLRLSVLYALLDCTLTVSVQHLKAALALWAYCEASAEAIFGNRIGDPVADRILDALREAGDEGMTDNDIYELFGRNRSANERERALALLKECGLVRNERGSTNGKGRPHTVWRAT